MLASLPKCCLNMLFEGSARGTEAGRGATPEQNALGWASFLLTYHFGKTTCRASLMRSRFAPCPPRRARTPRKGKDLRGEGGARRG